MNYISVDFHLQYLNSYTLFIQGGLKEDHLAVVNKDNEVVVCLSYDNENPSMEAARLLSMPFEHVYVSLPHQNIIWIPSEVFSLDDLSLYTDYFVHTEVEHIAVKQFSEQGITALYQIEPALQSRWRRLFPNVNIVPHFEAVLHQAWKHQDEAKSVLGVYVNDSSADLFLLVHGELRIYNTYEVKTLEDLSYFVLSIMKNFSIEGKYKQILLGGVSLSSVWAERLAFYGEEVKPLVIAGNWHSENGEVTQAIHKFSILEELVVCAS